MEPEELAEAVVRLSEWAQRHAPQPEPALHRRLQVAFDEWLTEQGVRRHRDRREAGYRAGLGELVRGGEWPPRSSWAAPST
jgi:hypothetical protein